MTAKEQAKAMSKTPTLIRPDKDSVTRFDPYYHLTEEDFNRILDAYAKHYMIQELTGTKISHKIIEAIPMRGSKVQRTRQQTKRAGARCIINQLLKELK